jgi:hypothetical protein
MAERPTTPRLARSGKKVSMIVHDVADPCKKSGGRHMVPCATYHASQQAVWTGIMRPARDGSATTGQIS